MAIVHHKVTGLLTLFILDQIQDIDHQLDEVKLTGTVTWTPVLPKGLSQAKATGPSRLVSLKPIKSLVSAGQIVSLSGTVSEIGDVPGEVGQELPVMIDGTPIWWQCSFDVRYESTPVIIPTMLVDATEGDVDITTIVSAGGFPEVPLDDVEAVIATVRSMSREAEAAFARATALADEVASAESSAADSAAAAAGSATTAGEKAQAASDDATRAEIAADRVGTAESVLDAAARAEAAVTATDGNATAADAAATRAEAAATTAEGAADAAATEKIADLVGTAPENLDTLGEIADKLADQDDVAAALTTQIAGKADKVHTHAVSDVTGLQTVLDGKAAASHTHTTAQVTGLDAALGAKLDASKIQVVAAMPATPVEGTIYFVTGA
ncbi:hypothetical protein [Corynebacterium variabile]|uniref:hypothetical protein n=1 Tax=Corynebacterium variabile TaxID=1727 RepID=UPI00289AAB41|nr:hypothetical protein [Corynebacterium variabile]